MRMDLLISPDITQFSISDITLVSQAITLMNEIHIQ